MFAERLKFHDALKRRLTGGCCAIGNFDGVHKGHQSLLKETQRSAPPYYVLTFDPHPRQVLRRFGHLGHGDTKKPTPEKDHFHLNDKRVQSYLLYKYGISMIVEIAFDTNLMALSADSFIELYIRPLCPQRIVVGEDFRFGKHRKGNVETLARALSSATQVHDVPLAPDDSAQTISSTMLREYLKNGLIENYTSCAGHPPIWIARVQRGDGLGRTLAMPTLNLIPSPELCYPPAGIYVAAAAPVGEQPRPAILYIGYRPSISSKNGLRLEVHILDQTVEWSAEEVKVSVYKLLRKDKKFNSLENLMIAMRQDAKDAADWWIANKTGTADH